MNWIPITTELHLNCNITTIATEMEINCNCHWTATEFNSNGIANQLLLIETEF